MSALDEIDRALLESVKARIENLSGLSGSARSKRFDFLLYYIQEKTGQPLSLTTLKRMEREY